MVFTLTDPRYQAISQIGSNFGAGLGDYLNQYVMNQQFQKAIGTGQDQINYQTPIQEVLSRFAKFNVSPEQQNLYFSPQVQQRLMQQGFGRFPGIGQIPSGNLGPMQGAPQNGLQQANPQQSNPNQLQGYQRSGQTPSVDHPLVNTPAMNASEYGFNPQPQDVGFQNQAAPTNPRVVAPYTDQEVAQLVAGWGPDAANALIKNRENQRQFQEDIKAEENRLRTAAFNRLKTTYGTIKDKEGNDTGEINLDPDLQELASMGMMQFTGTDEQRYAQTNDMITKIQNGLRNLSEGPTAPYFSALRPDAYKKYLRKTGEQIRNVLDNDRLPAAYRPKLLEKIKTIEAAKGNDLVETEYMANPPSDSVRKLIDSVPEVAFETRIGTERMKSKAKQQAIQRMTNVIAQSVQRDPYASPLIMRNRWLDKGYSEELISNAFSKAREDRVPFSSYQIAQLDELNKPERPSIATIFGRPGEESLRGIWDIMVYKNKLPRK